MPSFAAGDSVTEVAAELGISRGTAGKWRTRLLGRRLDGLSDEQRPGRPRTITDEHVEKVRDVVGLYLNPPENALVLRVGEKSQFQARDRTRSRACHAARRPGAADP